MKHTHLFFEPAIGRQKPENILNREATCPFCNRPGLEGILDERGSIIYLKNKYPVLQDAFQTVIIETDDCDSELSVYSKNHLHTLFRFSLEKWMEMEASGEFRSVMFYKNHGPYSGGSLKHPHMQIIGLSHIDYQEHSRVEHFEGITIEEKRGVSCNISSRPRAGFTEFNVILSDPSEIDQMADYVQMLTHYILHHFNQRCASYNLFFYHLDNKRMVKVVPRFVTSPLYVGYSIPQVSTNLEQVAKQIQSLYLLDR